MVDKSITNGGMKFYSCYDILIDRNEFIKFCSMVLPNLENDEQFYCSLLARNKWDKESNIGSKVQLKRFTSGNEYLMQKLTQLETKIGSYQDKSNSIPQANLGVYIMPNPRSIFNAGQDLIGEISGNTKKKVYHMNPQSMALSCIQTNCSRKIYYDLDVDIKYLDNKQKYIEFILINLSDIKLIKNEDFFAIETKNGCHILLKIENMVERLGRNWFKQIESVVQTYNQYYVDGANIEMNEDNLLPIPGCTQGGFIPKLI
jgi:hypothetical protein